MPMSLRLGPLNGHVKKCISIRSTVVKGLAFAVIYGGMALLCKLALPYHVPIWKGWRTEQ